MFYSKAITDELTRSILFSKKRYFKMNPASLFNFNLSELGKLMLEMRKGGCVSGNELRDKLGMDPVPELETFVALENYIPVSELGNQNKIKGGDDDGKEDAI